LRGFHTSVTKTPPFAKWALGAPAIVCFHARRTAIRRRDGQMPKGKKVTCEECFFRRNLLCALRLDEPCATFRPDSPEGLRPPDQLRFVFREQRTRAAYSFPTAQEQAERHQYAAA